MPVKNARKFRANRHKVKALPFIKETRRKIENAGYVDTAKRVKIIIGQVFRFAIANGWAESEPTYALTGALKPQKVNHYPTFTDAKDIALLM